MGNIIAVISTGVITGVVYIIFKKRKKILLQWGIVGLIIILLPLILDTIHHEVILWYSIARLFSVIIGLIMLLCDFYQRIE